MRVGELRVWFGLGFDFYLGGGWKWKEGRNR